MGAIPPVVGATVGSWLVAVRLIVLAYTTLELFKLGRPKALEELEEVAVDGMTRELTSTGAVPEDGWTLVEDVVDVPRKVEKAVPSEDTGAPEGTIPVLEGLEAGG